MSKELNLEAVAEGEAGEVPSCRLHFDGRVVTPVLQGCVFEGSLELDAGTIVFLTEDSPFEEALHIHLLDKHFQPKDHLVLSAPYTSGIVDALEQISSNRVVFEFPKSQPWRIDAYKEVVPLFRRPWNLEFRSLKSWLTGRFLLLHRVHQSAPSRSGKGLY